MYKILLNIHLALGLIITPFLFIYSISAITFSHHSLGFSVTDKKVEEFKLNSISTDPNSLADQLTEGHGIRGDLRKSSIDNTGKIKLLISRPGTRNKVMVDTKSGVATIEKETENIGGFINALHFTAGFESTAFGEKLWGLAVLLVAVSIIGVLITGLLLWLFNKKERMTGLIFLGVSITYSVSVLCVLRFG